MAMSSESTTRQPRNESTVSRDMKFFMRMLEERLGQVRKVVPASKVPPGKAGPWQVSRFKPEFTPMQIVRAMVGRELGRGITPTNRTYTRLTYNGNVMMSDTLDECVDMIPILNVAVGRVLVTGMGLGVVTSALCRLNAVTEVHVVEKDKQLAGLVERHIAHPKLTVHYADAFTWEPPTGLGFDCAWHDIWLILSADNLPEMAKLRRKYGKWMNSARAQLCWGEVQCREMERGW